MLPYPSSPAHRPSRSYSDDDTPPPPDPVTYAYWPAAYPAAQPDNAHAHAHAAHWQDDAPHSPPIAPVYKYQASPRTYTTHLMHAQESTVPTAVYHAQGAYPAVGVNYVLPPYDFREYPVAYPDPASQYAAPYHQCDPQHHHQGNPHIHGAVYEQASAPQQHRHIPTAASTPSAPFQKLDLFSPYDESPSPQQQLPHQQFTRYDEYAHASYAGPGTFHAYPPASSGVPQSRSSELGDALKEPVRMRAATSSVRNEERRATSMEGPRSRDRTGSPPMGHLPFPDEDDFDVEERTPTGVQSHPQPPTQRAQSQPQASSPPAPSLQRLQPIQRAEPRPDQQQHRHQAFHLVQDPAAYPEFNTLRKRRPTPLAIPSRSSTHSQSFSSPQSHTSSSNSFSSSPAPSSPHLHAHPHSHPAASSSSAGASSSTKPERRATPPQQTSTSTLHLVSKAPGQGVLKLPAPKRARKKPALACLFCRERKIACGPPVPGSNNPSCNQCARRQRKCEYPTESRRGQHKRHPRPAQDDPDSPTPVVFAPPVHADPPPAPAS